MTVRFVIDPFAPPYKRKSGLNYMVIDEFGEVMDESEFAERATPIVTELHSIREAPSGKTLSPELSNEVRHSSGNRGWRLLDRELSGRWEDS